MSRLDSRAYTWFVLCVAPQLELTVEKILGKEGYATFVPTRREYRFANHIARMKKRKTERIYPLMPRYIFVGMSDRTPGWERIFCFTGTLNYRRERIITSVLFNDGKPFEVPHNPIHDLMKRFSQGRFNCPEREKYMVTHREFKVGDEVLTEDGLFEGRVKDIDGDIATMLINIFGGNREIRVALDKLVAK